MDGTPSRRLLCNSSLMLLYEVWRFSKTELANLDVPISLLGVNHRKCDTNLSKIYMKKVNTKSSFDSGRLTLY